jgi:hypothetical protein
LGFLLCRRALGRLEDQVAANGWAWDADLSARIDTLHTRLEASR